MGDYNCVFSVEAFVDTVDFLDGFDESLDAKAAASHLMAELVIIFCDFPPLVAKPHPDTTPAWVTTRAGHRRLRCPYSCGQAALFQADPLALAQTIRSQPTQVLALGPPTGPADQQGGLERRVLHGSGALPTTAFGPKPPTAGGVARGRQGLLSTAWGTLEHALPLRDASGRTVAVALVALSLSAVNGALRNALLQEQQQGQQQPSQQQQQQQQKGQQHQSPHQDRSMGRGPSSLPSPSTGSERSGGYSDGETVVPPRARRSGAAPFGKTTSSIDYSFTQRKADTPLSAHPALPAAAAAAAAGAPPLDLPDPLTIVPAGGGTAVSTGGAGSGTCGTGTLSIGWDNAAGGFAGAPSGGGGSGRGRGGYSSLAASPEGFYGAGHDEDESSYSSSSSSPSSRLGAVKKSRPLLQPALEMSQTAIVFARSPPPVVAEAATATSARYSALPPVSWVELGAEKKQKARAGNNDTEDGDADNKEDADALSWTSSQSSPRSYDEDSHHSGVGANGGDDGSGGGGSGGWVHLSRGRRTIDPLRLSASGADPLTSVRGGGGGQEGGAGSDGGGFSTKGEGKVPLSPPPPSPSSSLVVHGRKNKSDVAGPADDDSAEKSNSVNTPTDENKHAHSRQQQQQQQHQQHHDIYAQHVQETYQFTPAPLFYAPSAAAVAPQQEEVMHHHHTLPVVLSPAPPPQEGSVQKSSKNGTGSSSSGSSGGAVVSGASGDLAQLQVTLKRIEERLDLADTRAAAGKGSRKYVSGVGGGLVDEGSVIGQLLGEITSLQEARKRGEVSGGGQCGSSMMTALLPAHTSAMAHTSADKGGAPTVNNNQSVSGTTDSGGHDLLHVRTRQKLPLKSRRRTGGAVLSGGQSARQRYGHNEEEENALRTRESAEKLCEGTGGGGGGGAIGDNDGGSNSRTMAGHPPAVPFPSQPSEAPPPPPPPAYSPGVGERIEEWFAAHEDAQQGGTVGLEALALAIAREIVSADQRTRSQGEGEDGEPSTESPPPNSLPTVQAGVMAAWGRNSGGGGAADCSAVGVRERGLNGDGGDGVPDCDDAVMLATRVSYAQAMGLLSWAVTGEGGMGDFGKSPIDNGSEINFDAED